MAGIIKKYTNNFKLKIPDFNIATWHDAMDENFTLLDALLGNFFDAAKFKGSWLQVTAYTAGDVVYISDQTDTYVGKMFKVLVNHTSGAGKFDANYALHPEWYELYADVGAVFNYYNGAKDFATKIDGKVVINGTEVDYSAKAYAIGGTGTETNNAKYYKEQAAIQASNAQISANNASVSAQSAEGSANSAGTSAGTATAAKVSAQDAATLSAQYATNSLNSSNTAADHASSASDSATLAESYKNTAISKAVEASNYATNASGYKDQSYQYSITARDYATNAANSATSSQNYATNSKKWAEGTDAEVEALGGTHSCKVWNQLIDQELLNFATKTELQAETNARTQADSTLQDNINIVSGNLSTHTAATNNPHSVTKAQVGLDNVDNTSDINKPISTATQNALDNKQSVIDSTHKLDSDLINDTNQTNKFVTAQDKANWNNKVDKNNPITAGTHTKITYDTKGLVTGGSDLTASDIPDLSATYYLASNPNGYQTASQVNTTVTSYHDSTKYDASNPSGFITASAVGNGTITIQKNGTTVDSFTTNQSANKTINIPVPKTLIFTNFYAENWTYDGTYSDFQYRCDIYLTGVTSSMSANVTYALQNALSGYYAPTCEVHDGYISIYSISSSAITIPTITVWSE